MFIRCSTVNVAMQLMFCLAFLCLNTIISVSCSWPRGTYGIPKPQSGCPSSPGWHTGMRIQKTELGSLASDGSHLSSSSSDPADKVIQEFCIKTEDSDYDDGSFMPGKYCLLKKGDCPPRFRVGFIYWDDAATLLFSETTQTSSGELPDGDFHRNTRIFYCCREDGEPNFSIKLPTIEPFFLFKYGGQCQQVADMNVAEEWMQWADEISFNLNAEDGVYPDMIRNKMHAPYTRLFYCFYSPKKGVDTTVVATGHGLHTIMVAAYVVGATVGFVLIIAIILTAIQRVLLMHQVRSRSCREDSERCAVMSAPPGMPTPRHNAQIDRPPSYDVALLDSARPSVVSPSRRQPCSGAVSLMPQMLTTDDVIRPPSYDDVLHEKMNET